jgi:hypothetical protein
MGQPLSSVIGVMGINTPFLNRQNKGLLYLREIGYILHSYILQKMHVM